MRATMHRESVHQISGLYKHAQQQFNKWNRIHVHVTMFVSVCTINTRQVYCMPHTCKTTRNHYNRSRVSEAAMTRILARVMANWKALYTTRGLCECVVNSLTRAVLNTAMGGARLLQPWNSLGPSINLVRSS